MCESENRCCACDVVATGARQRNALPYGTHSTHEGVLKGDLYLRRAIKLHGGSYDAFAKEVLGRSRVSVWRWLRKEKAIPECVIDRLKSYVQTHPQSKPQLQSSLTTQEQAAE